MLKIDSRSRALGAALATLASVLLAASQATAAFPDRPIRLIVPFAARGSTDAVARAVAQKMAADLGQPVIVENKVGAAGDIGADLVARSAPDGLTLLYHSSGLTISPALKKKPAFDPIKDFAPVSLMASIPGVLVVNPKLPATTLPQFVQYLKVEGGKAAHGSGGVGNGSHLMTVLFLRAVGAEAVHVPYKGTNPALMDVIGGQVQFMFDALSSALPQIREQRLRALAVTVTQRSALLPDVPTIAESGVRDLQFETWQGILAPAATPQTIVQRLNAAAVKSANDPDVQRQFSPLGVVLKGTSPAEFSKPIASEVARWAEAVRAAGVPQE